MDEHQHHDELVRGAVEQFRTILDGSEQAIYLYLDDTHKACNDRFARLLGYSSPDEWAAVDDSFLDRFVDPRSQRTLASTYQGAMERLTGSSIDVRWRTKAGGTVDSSVVLVPISHSGHLFALHFISA
jgi:PAS domain-containing protein